MREVITHEENLPGAPHAGPALEWQRDAGASLGPVRLQPDCPQAARYGQTDQNRVLGQADVQMGYHHLPRWFPMIGWVAPGPIYGRSIVRYGVVYSMESLAVAALSGQLSLPDKTYYVSGLESARGGINNRGHIAAPHMEPGPSA